MKIIVEIGIPTRLCALCRSTRGKRIPSILEAVPVLFFAVTSNVDKSNVVLTPTCAFAAYDNINIVIKENVFLIIILFLKIFYTSNLD
ncbi:hypothetical protein J8N07_03880 [Chryseobacterium arthrosphaerae]|uniref:hypothetical protein n=1 Tax=Chryseobacterium arthrosphaerae TaxID=651561 RepID=UPI001E38A802|nr:hypothetical protein [Chryseobacterium arthrosphaerae]UEQ77455.1 hypothetical protein J8N07_03880 [Chryseobacterium arthrosphaerae]